MKRTMTKLGESLKARRTALGLTQRSLAQKLSVEASHVAFIESGRRKPSLKLVARIAETLGLDPQELLVLAPIPKREFSYPLQNLSLGRRRHGHGSGSSKIAPYWRVTT